MPLSRRTFLSSASSAAAGALVAPSLLKTASEPAPRHLAPFSAIYQDDPRAASVAWFKQARFGLFMHFGLYSLVGRHEWVQYREQIPVAEYGKLKDRFAAERFDADFITDLALEAGMRYITITSRHHDSFSLFSTSQSDFNSVQSPCGRDLIGELSEQCRQKEMPLFLYYSYACDWRHPYFYPRESGWSAARPDYKEPQPEYRYRSDDDFARYIAFVHAQLTELLTQYGPLAGIWFDPIMGYYARPDLFPIDETYALVRRLQPHILISFKQGASGDEDFAAPERSGVSLEERVREAFGEENARIAAHAWDANRKKKLEFCDTMQPHGWGYIKEDDGNHKTPDEVMAMLERSAASDANLLLNTGPLPDGSIHPEDVATLREIGKRLRSEGFPG